MKAIIGKEEEINGIIKDIKEIKDTLGQLKEKSIENEWLDNQDVCQILKISKRTLQSYRDNGVLPYSQFGNKIYYRASDIKKHLEDNYHNFK
jgi:hypothetical protein